MDSLFSKLVKCHLFEGVSSDELHHLFSTIHYKIKCFKENEIIFSSHQIADTIGIILSGAVDVQKLFPCGKVVTIARRTSFNLIADAAVFSKSKYYPAIISTCKPCEIVLIPKEQMLKLFTMNLNIMSNFLESVSNNTLVLNQKVELLALNAIAEKIAFYVISESENNNISPITLPFSKKTWAEYMNISRTSLSRELRQLENAGILSFDKRKIWIRNMDKLKKLLERN